MRHLRHPRILLLAIFVVALTLRLSLFLYMGEGFWLTADSRYDRIASNIVEGKGYYLDGSYLEGLGQSFTGKEKIYSFRAPLYAYVLAGLYGAFGRAPLTVGIFQAVISSVTVLLLFVVARRLFDERVGLGTAAVAAVYPYSIFHDIRVMETPLFELLLVLLVWSILRLAEEPSVLNAVLTGALSGLAVHCRSAFLLFTAVLLLSLVISNGFTVRQVLRVAIPIIISEFVVLSPWLIRNYFIHHRPLLSTYGGWNFLLGNNELTMNEIDNRREIDTALSNHLRSTGVTLEGLTEVEMDDWFYQRGIAFIKKNPRTFIELLFRKAINLWSVWLNPAADSRWKDLVYSVSYGSILVVGAVGIIISLSDWKRFLLIYLLFFYFTVSYSPYITLSRYRKPLDPYLAMFGVYGVSCLYERLRRRGEGGEAA